MPRSRHHWVTSAASAAGNCSCRRSGTASDTELGEPVLCHRDVDPLVATDTEALVVVAVAGHGDDLAVQEQRTTRVAGAGPAGALVVVGVHVGLEDLRGQLLSGHVHEAAE